MEIDTTFTKINDEFSNESKYICTDYFDGVYVVKTQIKHLTFDNNHSNNTIW